jgi:hypothetical protein
MSEDGSVDESFGDIDTTSLEAIREVFYEEPLVESAGFDEITNPRKLNIEFSDGVTSSGTLTVRWSIRGYYSFHYSEEDIQFRFDHHDNPHSPKKHFHPPPSASTEGAEESCIEVEVDELVARAVLKLWRRWYESDGEIDSNKGEDPP